MENIKSSLYNLRLLDDLAHLDSFIHKLHPLIKLLTTIVFLVTVVSFQKTEIIRLIPFFFYPILIFTLAEIPLLPILKRVLLVAPFIIGIGIFNPMFDQHSVFILGIEIAQGWLTFISLCVKGLLTVTASLLLIATTGMERIAAALRTLKVPKLFVMQLLLTYRYISVLIEEVGRMLRAYSLRAPGQKGIERNAWGPFAGQLILRTFERAQRVYQAMNLRGFTGEYYTGTSAKFGMKDLVYFAGWSLLFILSRLYNLPLLLGQMFTGG
ncbi:cobalt ECF transporter T component CbiQ [Bacillus sp. DNRA2]|uniref:cobalt ECF transporter T component CbiQ n=1 Tax=Bacillus sp. DNRA2 TaxID=2723053 RepID=UPI00145F9AAE|nr:cobalt ECF transporter T component CbiQ [Bacillus sp. DNRA2]NMD71086.1 cobalt ECF transporter T component CbiQ [Bacillus sp. DNRA2]